MKVVFQIAMTSVELKSKRWTSSTAHNYRDIKLNFYLKKTTLVLHFISMNTSMTVMFFQHQSEIKFWLFAHLVLAK